MFVLNCSYRDKIRHYVENGGTVLATFLTSVKTVDNTGYTESLPAGLTDVFGVTVQEVEPIDSGTVSSLELKLSGEPILAQDHYWSELLGGTAEMKGVYTEDYKKGQGVISRNAYGKGHAWYMGTMPEKQAFTPLIEEVSREAGL